MTAEDDAEKVGYRNPPRKSRFKSGQSGNPKGRPKRSGNVAVKILAELKQSVTVRENGRERILTKGEALAKALMARALSGDIRAIQMIANLLPGQFRQPEDPTTRTEAVDGDREAQIVERFIARKFGVAAADTAPSTFAPLENPASDKENVNDDHYA